MVEVPGARADLDWTLQASGVASTRVLVEEAWLVGLPAILVDLADTAPPGGWIPAQSQAGAAVTAGGTLRLRDGYAYGPRALALPLGGDSGASGWRAEWPLRLPEGPSVLRGLLGLAADAPAGSKATVALRLSGGERDWPLIENLALEVPAGEGGQGTREPSATIEVAVPRELARQEATLVLEVAAAGGVPCRLGLPHLSLSLP